MTFRITLKETSFLVQVEYVLCRSDGHFTILIIVKSIAYFLVEFGECKCDIVRVEGRPASVRRHCTVSGRCGPHKRVNISPEEGHFQGGDERDALIARFTPRQCEFIYRSLCTTQLTISSHGLLCQRIFIRNKFALCANPLMCFNFPLCLAGYYRK